MKTKLIAFLVVCLFASATQAATVDESITDFSIGISKFLQFKRETQIFVEPIIGPKQIGSATPSSIREIFCKSLAKNQIMNSPNARLRIITRCEHVFDSTGRTKGIKIQGLLVDQFDDVLLAFTLHANESSAPHQLVQTSTTARRKAPSHTLVTRHKDRRSHSDVEPVYQDPPKRKSAPKSVTFVTPKKRSDYSKPRSTVIEVIFREPLKRR